MRVEAYLRVSSNEQSYENQYPAVRDWCKAHWWPEPDIYAESESAWKAGHQRELAKLLDDIRSGRRKYDYLIVWALDRLCRQGIGPVLQFVSTFETYGVKVVSIQESWTATEGPMRELFIAMAAWAAKFESDRRSERTLAELDRARANGKKLGRPEGSKDNRQRRRSGYLLRYTGQINVRQPTGVEKQV